MNILIVFNREPYDNTDHSIAREKGRKEWYKSFKTRIAKVERDYEFE